MEVKEYKVNTNKGHTFFKQQPTPEQFAAVGGIGEVETIYAEPNRDEVFNRISLEHDALFAGYWSALNYISEAEVNSAAIDEFNPYNSEAKALLRWYWATWDIIETAEITAETDVAEFIAALPKFEL